MRSAPPVVKRAFSPSTSRRRPRYGRPWKPSFSQFGRLDILFNNAGIVLGGTVETTEESDWERTMAVNVRSVFLGCKFALPIMRRQGGGVIVNTASVAGLVGVKDRAAYSASKAAVVGLTKSIAIDYVGREHPRQLHLPRHGRHAFPTAADRRHRRPVAGRQAFIARQPMGRLGTAEEIAQLALYLASDESAYMTGSAVVIDGGLSL